MYCFNCGHQIPDDSVFCPECGCRVDTAMAELEDEPSTSTTETGKPITPPMATPLANQQVPSPQNEDVAATTPAASHNSPGKKKSKALIVVPIVVLVLILGIAAAGVLTGWFGLAGSNGIISVGQGVPVRDSVNDYSWEELSAISDEISAASSEDEALEIAKNYHLCNEDGTLDGTQTKEVELSNGVTSSVEIIGFAHDDASDGSGKTGITFAFTEMVDFAPMSTRGSNEGGWKYSDLRTQLNSDFLDMLPEDLQENIVEVDKSTNNVGAVYDSSSQSFVTTCISTTPDKIWIPSYTEVVGDISGSIASHDSEGMAEVLGSEGIQYQLYSDLGISQGNTPADLLTLNVADGTDASAALDAGLRWTRTSDPTDQRYAYTIHNTNGNCNESHTVVNVYGIAPCFCI